MNFRIILMILTLLMLGPKIAYATEEESVEAPPEMQNPEESTHPEGMTQRYQEVKQHYDEVMIKYNEIMNTYEDLSRRFRELQMHDKGAAGYPELKQQYEEELNHYHNVLKKGYDEALTQYHEAKRLYDEEVGQHNETGEHEPGQEIPVAREAPREIPDGGHETMMEHEEHERQPKTALEEHGGDEHE